MQKTKILIVDDFALIRTAWKVMFNAAEQYSIVAEAKNGQEAVRICGLMEIDLVLMDITMPVMDGIEATRIICKKPNPPRIIGLSMHTEKQFITNMLEAGAKGYVTKDASFKELCSAIDSVMNNGIYLGQNLRYDADGNE